MESREEKHIQAHFLLMFSFFSSLWFIYCTFNQPSWFYEMLKDSSSILLSPCQPPEENLAVLRLPPAVGLVNTKLWGSVLGAAPSLIPCSCLGCASSRAWHSCAQLSTPQTPELGASPQPLVDTPQAEAVSTALDSSISHAGRAAEGATQQEGSSMPAFEKTRLCPAWGWMAKTWCLLRTLLNRGTKAFSWFCRSSAASKRQKLYAASSNLRGHPMSCALWAA